MKILTFKWLRGLAGAVITGLSTSFLSALGITGAEMLGVKVVQLDWKQLAVITCMGGAVGLAAYLKQSPVPPMEEDKQQNGER
jgi:hypothetical protein